MSDSEHLIKNLKLISHPEGGHFSESFRDSNNNVSLIYYMLQQVVYISWRQPVARIPKYTPILKGRTAITGELILN